MKLVLGNKMKKYNMKEIVCLGGENVWKDLYWLREIGGGCGDLEKIEGLLVELGKEVGVE